MFLWQKVTALHFLWWKVRTL